MSRYVIVGGAEILDYEAVKTYLRNDDYFVYCDCGLRHKESLGFVPDLIIGDFDSHERPEDAHNVIVLPCVKDDTDTIFAVKEGIRRGYDDFLMIGASGGRLDHTLGNVYALMLLKSHGAKAMMLDDYSEIELVCAGETGRVSPRFKYFSVISIAGTSRGITITGAKYPLNDADITSGYQYGISNEVSGSEAVITLKEGCLLLVRVR